MKDKSQIVSARRTVDVPWAYGLSNGIYNLVGKGTMGSYYSKSPWAYACAQIRGMELANLPWHIIKNGQVMSRGKLVNMITEFGPESNYVDAIMATEMDLLRSGAAYWLRDVDILKRLNPDTVELQKDNNGISGFKQTITLPNGKTKINEFNRDEVVYFREYNPFDDLDAGVAVLDVVKDAINAEYEALKMVAAHFANDATPSLLLTTEQTVPDNEMERVLGWWQKRFGGSRNKGKVAMADKGLKAQVLSQSLRENAITEIMDRAHKDICVGMRVPGILVGDMTDATYANAQEARKFMVQDNTIPRAKMFQDAINQDLIRVLDPAARFEFDFDAIEILQEDATAKWQRLKEARELGLVSDQYIRAEMGYPEEAAPDNPEARALRAWQKKATNAVKRGESADVPFETEDISADKQHLLHARLSNVNDIDGVMRAFA